MYYVYCMQYSWFEKMMERLWNVIQTDKRKSKDQLDIPSVKRHKGKEDSPLRMYPSTVELHDQVDEDTAAQHCS